MTDFSDCVCIFDLDGTLVDSAPDLTEALNRALLREGLSEIDLSQVRPIVGEGARAMLRKGFAMQGRTFPEDQEGDRIVSEYVEDYAANIFEHSFVFENVTKTLEQLKSNGAKLAVCTNKTERLSEPLLERAELVQFFEEIVSADSLPEKKPSGLPLTTIMERTGCSKAVMIGDTATDLGAAEAAGVPCLIANFGYGANDPRVENSQKFEGFDELPGLIAEQLSK